jgi:hypothetical protein
MVRKGAGAGSYHLGEFLVSMTPAAFTAVTAVAAAWIHGRAGRKVRIKIGDVEAEASTMAEIDQLLKKAKDFSPPPSDE